MNQKKSLQYRIVGVSSEDPQYPSVELLNPSSNSKGWQTERFAVFPQQLVIQFMNPSKINSLQLLSHQCKISTKIEVYIAYPNKMSHMNVDEIPFRKIGYFVLSSNEKNNFHSRELKTVFIDAPALFLKLNFMKPYVNSVNVFNQVGVIGLQIYGEELNSENLRNPLNNQTSNIDLQTHVKFDKKTLSQLETLEQEKNIAIEEDDLMRAKDISNKIKQIKQIGEQLMRLEERKQIAIQNDDFEAAIVIKEEIDKLRYQSDNQRENNYRQKREQMNSKRKNNYRESPQKREENFAKNSEEEYKNENSYRNMNVDRFEYKEEVEEKPQIDNKRDNKRVRHYQNKKKEVSEKEESEVEKEEKSERNFKNFNREVLDDRPLPALLKNNNMNEFPQDEEDDNKKSNDEEPKLNKAALQKVASFSEYFDESFLYFAFSSIWSQRNDSCEKLTNFLQKCLQGNVKLPNNEILPSNLESAILAIWKLNLNFLEDRVPKITQNSLSIFQNILELKIKLNNQLNLKSSEIGSLIEKSMMIFMDKMSEYKNQGLIEGIIQNIVLVHKSGLSKIEEIIPIFTKTKNLHKKYSSFKCLTGRLFVLKYLVSELANDINKGTLNKLIEFAAVNYENQNKEVRIESHNLILEVFKIIGEDKTLQCLESTKIRNAHIETLKTDFNAIRSGGGNLLPKKNSKVVQKPTNHKKQNKDDSEEEHHQIKKNRRREESEQENDAEEREDEEAEEDEEEEEEEERDKVCNFCKRVDDNFLNSDQFDMHLWKECPMLSTCPYCKQVVEICELNEHLLTECAKSNYFSKCPRCQRAVLNEDFEEHTSKMKCKVFKLDGRFDRCPLCQTDIELNFEDIETAWRNHLVVNGCSNNERTH